LKEISTLIFDLGGVLVNLEPERTLAAFEALGMANVNYNFTPANQPDVFSAYETGRMSDSEFIRILREHMAEGTTDAEVIEAWNCMILDFPRHRIEVLQSLKKRYRLILLSNTNPLHIEYFLKGFQQQHPEIEFADLFDAIYYSHEIQLRKPDLNVFEFILQTHQLQAAECCFIDDNLVNTEASSILGINSLHFNRNSEIGEISQFNNFALRD
jgi:glucose-1-phosphatase